MPFEMREVEGRAVQLETIPEIIAKKICCRGLKPSRVTFLTSLLGHGPNWEPLVNALRAFPHQLSRAKEKLTRSLWVVP